MKINIEYLKKINIFYSKFKYYKKKYNNEDFDLLKDFIDSEKKWKIWFLGNARTKEIKYLLKNKFDINMQNNSGHTALIFASWYDHLENAKLLLKHGADIKIRDKFDQTALFYAVQYGNLKIVKLLLKHGADINIKNDVGETVLSYANYHNYTNIKKLLLKRGAIYE